MWRTGGAGSSPAFKGSQVLNIPVYRIVYAQHIHNHQYCRDTIVLIPKLSVCKKNIRKPTLIQSPDNRMPNE